MKNFTFYLYTLLFAIISSAHAQTVNTLYQDGKVWVKLKNTSSLGGTVTLSLDGIPEKGDLNFLRSIPSSAGVKKVSQTFATAASQEMKNIYLLEVNNPYKIDEAIEALNANSEIEYVEKVPLDRTMLSAPNDPSYTSQWELGLINAPAAWNFLGQTSNIVVALIDDGVQIDHPDLNIYKNASETLNGIDDDNNGYIDDINGYDVADNDNNPGSSVFSHGTQIAGVIGAKTNNGSGIASLGYGSFVLPVKAATDNTPAGTITHGYDGIMYAIASGAKVLCLSWASPVSTLTGQSVINYARSQGCVIVAAAGNDNTNKKYYPAGYTHVIAVAATRSDDVKTSFSNYGTWIDLSAPGENIYTTALGSSFTSASGTSVAAGLTASLVSLMLANKSGCTPADIDSCLKQNAQNINVQNPTYTNKLGRGRIDASASVGCLNLPAYNIPDADFEANMTTIYVGGNVKFTNKSIHNAVSYSWAFQGGTPATALITNPPAIKYNTPGVYSVTLTATNSSGSDSEIKTAYINVISGNEGCDTINWKYSLWGQNLWARNAYRYPDTAASGGYAHGLNSLGHKEIAQLYGITGNKRNLYKVSITLGVLGVVDINSKYIKIKIYGVDSTTRQPIDIGASVTTVPINTITKPLFTNIKYQTFDLPLTSIPGTGIAGVKPDSFFVSLALTGGGTDEGNLVFSSTPGLGDTLAIIGSLNSDPPAGQINWIKKSDNTWCHNATGSGCTPWTSIAKSKMWIFPHLTDLVPEATLISSADTICKNNYIAFDATGSTFINDFTWSFPGGNPSTSNKLKDTVYFSNSGPAPVQYEVKLKVTGGSCAALSDSSIKIITVNPSPIFTITTTPGSTICDGSSSSVTVSASGSSSYKWSPATGLNTTTGPVVIASPTKTQTYEVFITNSNGCFGSSAVTIRVDSIPDAIASVFPTFACPDQAITLNAALSKNGDTFTWLAPGSSAPTSSSANQIVSYSSFGTYTITLTVSNSCGEDSSFMEVIEIGCQNIDELFSEKSILSFYNDKSKLFEIGINNQNDNQHIQVMLVSSLGQILYNKQENISRGYTKMDIDVSRYSKGTYQLMIRNNEGSSYQKKLMVY